MSDGVAAFSRIQRSGSFQLDLAPAEAFKLFTAAGERLWVPGWSPTIHGALPQAPGLVFTTGAEAEFTIWTVLDHDPAAGVVRYSRVTPGSRAGIVAIEVSDAMDGSTVRVDYDLTAISADGEASLENYSACRFARMMEDWRRLIVEMAAQERAGLGSLVV